MLSVWLPPHTVNSITCRPKRYWPRIERLFTRIEHWDNSAGPKDTFWRSISKNNITTWYGKNDSSRIFSWLIRESYNDEGNVIIYGYKQEDAANVELSQAHERDRNRSANRQRL